jgi:hypothetical protein
MSARHECLGCTDHAGGEGVEHDDLEVLEQAGRQVHKVGGGNELSQLACLMHGWSPLPVKSSRKSMPSMIYISGCICHAALTMTLC